MRYAIAVACLFLAGCGAADVAATSSTTRATTSTTSTTVTTTTTTTGPTESTTTTTTDPTAIFDETALVSLIDSIVADLGIEDLGPVPIPDLTNPDPVIAAQERNDFSDWVHTTYPHPAWAAVLTAADSPARRNWEGSLARIFGDGAKFVFVDEAWTWTNYREVPDDEVDDLAFRLTLPRERVFVAADMVFGDYEIRSLDDDEVLSSHAGQTAPGLLFVLVATEFGWQAWSER